MRKDENDQWQRDGQINNGITHGLKRVSGVLYELT